MRFHRPDAFRAYEFQAFPDTCSANCIADTSASYMSFALKSVRHYSGVPNSGSVRICESEKKNTHVSFGDLVCEFRSRRVRSEICQKCGSENEPELEFRDWWGFKLSKIRRKNVEFWSEN